jgi:hypothetical protein
MEYNVEEVMREQRTWESYPRAPSVRRSMTIGIPNRGRSVISGHGSIL